MAELFSRLLRSGEAWFRAEMQLVRLDLRQIFRRTVTCIFLLIMAFAFLNAALLVFFTALVPTLAASLDSMVLAGVLVGGGLFLAGGLLLLAAWRALWRGWNAASTPLRALTAAGTEQGKKC